MTRILGCDPGLTGAVALYDDDLDALIVRDAPTVQVSVGRSKARKVYQDAEYARIIRELAPDVVAIEQVNGIKGQSASASFSFGAGYGLLRGIVAALGLPVHFIPPQTWRARLRVPSGKDGSRLRAGQLFPRYANLFVLVKYDGRADAALITKALLGFDLSR